MALTGILSKIGGMFARRKSKGDPRLEQAMVAAEMAEAHILAQFPDGNLTDEAKEQLAKIKEVQNQAAQALAADEAGDLQTLVATAKKVRATRDEHGGNTAERAPVSPAQAIFDAITFGGPDALKAALDGADVNGSYGDPALTPLMRAMITPDVQLASFLVLLEAGADATMPTPWGGSALSGMASGDFDHWTAEETAALAIALRDLGASFDTPDDDGQLPLHAAVIRGNQGVVKAFAAAGANLDARMSDTLEDETLRGGTPLHMAVWSPDMLDTLLALGADITVENAAGLTPADFAAAALDDEPEAEDIAPLQASVEVLQQARAA